MNLLDEAKSIISIASETIEECKSLADNESFVIALSEEVDAIHKLKSKRKNPVNVVFGVNEAGDVLMLGTTPIKASVIRECVCHVMIPVKTGASEVESLRKRTYSTLSEIASKHGKTDKEFKDLFEASVNTYISDNDLDADNLTKSDWKSIAEHVVINHILPVDNKNSIELGDGDIGKLVENLSTTKKNEAIELLERLLKIDIDLEKRKLLKKLNKDNNSEDIPG